MVFKPPPPTSRAFQSDPFHTSQSSFGIQRNNFEPTVAPNSWPNFDDISWLPGDCNYHHFIRAAELINHLPPQGELVRISVYSLSWLAYINAKYSRFAQLKFAIIKWHSVLNDWYLGVRLRMVISEFGHRVNERYPKQEDNKPQFYVTSPSQECELNSQNIIYHRNHDWAIYCRSHDPRQRLQWVCAVSITRLTRSDILAPGRLPKIRKSPIWLVCTL